MEVGDGSSRLKSPNSSATTRHTVASPDKLHQRQHQHHQLLHAESTFVRSPSGRLSRSSSFRKNDNDTSGSNHPLPSSSANNHLMLKNYKPTSLLSSTSSSFFLVVTGNIESAISSETSCLNEKLYCRYSFSYGEDWEVVHGVSMGLTQIASRGMISNNDDEGGNIVVFNFPIEISLQSTNPHGWPRLALSIFGFDFMGRDVVKGYASVLLPITPGRHTKIVRTYRPVSGSKFVEFVNWLMGTNPEYYDSKITTRGDGRAVTRVVNSDRTLKVNLFVTVKDFASFGYISSAPPA